MPSSLPLFVFVTSCSFITLTVPSSLYVAAINTGDAYQQENAFAPEFFILLSSIFVCSCYIPIYTKGY